MWGLGFKSHYSKISKPKSAKPKLPQALCPQAVSSGTKMLVGSTSLGSSHYTTSSLDTWSDWEPKVLSLWQQFLSLQKTSTVKLWAIPKAECRKSPIQIFAGTGLCAKQQRIQSPRLYGSVLTVTPINLQLLCLCVCKPTIFSVPSRKLTQKNNIASLFLIILFLLKFITYKLPKLEIINS